MELKKNIQSVLNFLKKEGHNRRLIEKRLCYKEYYIDQALSREGTEELLKRLEFYKQFVLLETRLKLNSPNSAWQDHLRYISPEDIAEALQVLAVVASKIGSKKEKTLSKEPDTSNNKKIRAELQKGTGYKRGKSGKA